jgi:hypothetical protein
MNVKIRLFTRKCISNRIAVVTEYSIIVFNKYICITNYDLELFLFTCVYYFASMNARNNLSSGYYTYYRNIRSEIIFYLII